jgi:signal transduction histidine kinase
MTEPSLLRSSTFRLAFVYMFLFAGSVLVLLGFIYLSTVGFMNNQVDTTIETEIVGLAERYRDRGLNGLVRTINERVERNPTSSSIYLFAAPNFRPLAGNLTRWPEGQPGEDGWLEFEVDDPASGLQDIRARARVFVLQGNFKLLVGRDVRELTSTRNLIERALLWGVVITVALGLAGGVMMSRAMLRRLDEINATSREIMAGDLSRRIPTRGNADDFDQLAGNLNAMLDEIERLMDGIRHVSDNIAHDLRTPLTRLRQRLESLLARRDTDESHALLEESIADADQLLATFASLLRIARIEAGGYQKDFEAVDLAGLVRDAGELYEALADDRDLSLEVEAAGPISVHGDRDLLFQAVINLLDNALKYTPAGGAIMVSAEIANSHPTLTVADTGPGIPADERGNVTRRFYRVDSSRTLPGSGLGLSLVAAVAHIHKAELRLEDNEPGLRARLVFELLGSE